MIEDKENYQLITISLTLIAIISVAFALYFTRPIMIPFILALFVRILIDPIIDFQTKYLDSSGSDLKPMVLKDIANKIDMDISTVSRVTSSKYIQFPWGVKHMKSLFSEGINTKSGEQVSSIVIKDMIRDIINKEDKKNPILDEKITEKLYLIQLFINLSNANESISLKSLYEKIIDAIGDDLQTKTVFEHKISKIYGKATKEQQNEGFIFLQYNLYLVDDNFPKIDADNLPEGVLRVRYQIDSHKLTGWKINDPLERVVSE